MLTIIRLLFPVLFETWTQGQLMAMTVFDLVTQLALMCLLAKALRRLGRKEE